MPEHFLSLLGVGGEGPRSEAYLVSAGVGQLAQLCHSGGLGKLDVGKPVTEMLFQPHPGLLRKDDGGGAAFQQGGELGGGIPAGLPAEEPLAQVGEDEAVCAFLLQGISQNRVGQGGGRKSGCARLLWYGAGK